MKEDPPKLELLEPANPESLVPASWIEPWMILTLVGVILILGVFWLIRKKRTAAADPLAARNAAYQEAVAALERIVSPHARDTAVQCSLILRKYLSVAAGDPALYETHEEFISRRDSLLVLNEAARTASETGFTRFAALKYAPEIPENSPQEVVAESRSLLETLHHGFMP